MLSEKLYNAFCHIKYGNMVNGKKYLIRKNARIKSGKKGKIQIGKVLINENAFICSSGEGRIVIGDNVTINRNSILVAKELIEIGEGTSIGPNVCIYDHNHRITENGFIKNEFRTGKVSIGKNVWIGANVTLLKGCEIGDNSVIAAGVVLDTAVPPNSIVRRAGKTVVEELRKK